METSKVKVIDKRNGVVKEVNEKVVSDYLSTGNFEIYKLTTLSNKEKPKKSFYVNEDAKSKF